MIKSLIFNILKHSIKILLISIVMVFIFVSAYIQGIKYHPNYKLADEILIQSEKYCFANILSMKNLINLPKNHLEMLNNAGYKIEINKDKIVEYSKANFRFFAGLTVYADKKIYLYPVCNQVGANLLHEVGHAISKINNDIDESQEFENIYNNEKSKIRKYSQRNSSEFFADIYMLQFNDFWFDFKKEDFPQASEYLKSLSWWDN